MKTIPNHFLKKINKSKMKNAAQVWIRRTVDSYKMCIVSPAVAELSQRVINQQATTHVR